MLFSIIGASSTGKTTLIDLLSQSLDSISDEIGVPVEVHPEYPRILFDEKYKDKYESFNDLLSDSEMAIKFQFEICEYTLNLIDKICTDDKIHILDGATISCMVYLYLNYSSAAPEHQYKYGPEFIKTMTNLSRASKEFTQLIRIHPYNDLTVKGVVDDGFRPRAYEYRRYLELKLFDLVCASNRDIVTDIYNTDTDTRYSSVVATIKYLVSHTGF